MKRLVKFLDKIIPADERPVWWLLILFAFTLAVMFIIALPKIIATI